MFELFFSVSIAFGITFFSLPVIIYIAQLKKLYDLPSERKLHINRIAALGGVGIFAGFTISCLLTVSFYKQSELQYFLAAALVIFFLGLKDDILILSPLKKLVGQLIAVFILVYKGGFWIKSLHGFAGIYDMPASYGMFFSFLGILIVINSFNLIDGVDGLAACLGVMATVILGFYFIEIGQLQYTLLSFALAGSLLAFLCFNFHPARIFMGDTGSLIIGLICAILIVKFINEAPAGKGFAVPQSPAMALAILFIPVMDTLRVFGMRVLNGISPFRADRTHIHHILLDKGISQKNVTLILSAINLITIGIVFLLKNIGTTWLIILMVAGYFAGLKIYCLATAQPKLAALPERSIEGDAIPLTPVRKVVMTKQVVTE